METMTPIRELDQRTNDGIDVRLLWNQRDGTLTVAVLDTRKRERFCIDVRRGDRPADVFHHPYAYAAHRGIVPTSDAGELRERVVQPV